MNDKMVIDLEGQLKQIPDPDPKETELKRLEWQFRELMAEIKRLQLYSTMRSEVDTSATLARIILKFEK